MTTRVYKIVMTPEDTDDRVAYLIDKTGEPPVTEANAADAFDTILCNNDGYELDSFKEIAESDIPADAHPYQVG
jgi:hypothetical protein